MKTRDFALQVVSTVHLEEKLASPPRDVCDGSPGEPLRLLRPGRPRGLEIVPASRARVPPVEGYHDPGQRARILHAFTNHEFQAVELFAWALLAFPDAPAELRRGLLDVLVEEQRHCRMYIGRLEAAGARFGDYPVSGYFWNKTPSIRTPLAFVCAMSLTFENANLDHTVESAQEIRRAGDIATARVVERIHRDEIRHVRFGWKWLARLKDPGQSMWESYCANVAWPLRPALARGKVFHPGGRAAAGLDPEFIRLLSRCEGHGASG